SSGSGMVRAYVTFAGRMLALAADLLESSAPEEASLCARAAEARTELHAALAEARVDYIGEDPHSSESRLNRFLRRLAQDNYVRAQHAAPLPSYHFVIPSWNCFDRSVKSIGVIERSCFTC